MERQTVPSSARLLSEGILLLAIVTPVALLIDYNLANLELNSWRNGTTLESGPSAALCRDQRLC